ncbi:hypothetical protein RQP46_008016 [Phenoliferia psychrophenolica]
MDQSGPGDAHLPSSNNSDDEPDAPLPPPPPPNALPLATFATLPLELKAIVVAYVCANDREHLVYRSRAGKEEAALIKVVETPWHGRGLFAVAAVSRELNAICAEHLFESLTPNQACSPILARRILPKHAKRIRVLHLTDTVGDAKRAFEVLAVLSNLAEIQIDNLTANQLFGKWPTSEGEPEEEEDDDSDGSDFHDAGQAVRRVLFRPGATTVTRLHFEGPSLQQVRGMVGALVNLRSVSMDWIEPLGQVEAIIDALAAAPFLRELTLELHKSMHITSGWSSPTFKRPALSALNLRGVNPSSETFDFIATFAPTLESLEISFKKRSPLSVEPTTSSLFLYPFPLLSQLRMVDLDLDTASLILQSLAEPAVSSTSPLRQLDLELRKPPADVNKSLFKKNYDRFILDEDRRISHLRLVEVGSLAELWCFCGINYDGRPTLRSPLPRELFWARLPVAQVGEENPRRLSTVAMRATVLRNTLEFGLAHLDTLEAEEDLVGMETAFEALKTMRVWQKVVRGK